MVLEYKGEEYQRFHHLVQHLFRTLNIDNYYIYRGKKRDYLQVFIEVKQLNLKEVDKQLKKLSDALEKKMTKRWKCLPSSSLPEAYNIITLPYQEI